MTLSAKGINHKILRIRLRIPNLTWFSLPRIRGLALGVTGCLLLTFILAWYPSYLKFKSLQKEKNAWQSQINTNQINSELIVRNSPSGSPVIPTIDQLPELIEECCRAFVRKGVDVTAFNVERFGGSQPGIQDGELDYALVRLRLQGPWQGVESGLKTLEETQDISVHVLEVNLNSGGGESLLQVYFCSSEPESQVTRHSLTSIP